MALRILATLACILGIVTTCTAQSDPSANLLSDLQLVQAQPTPPRPPQPVTTPPRTPVVLSPTGQDIGSTSIAALTATPIPEMMGDFFTGRMGSRVLLSRIGLPVDSIRTAAGSRGFKVADNESPLPQDRVYVIFNYFDDFGKALNASIGETERFDDYRPTLGIELTCLDGNASVGLRLPVHHVYASSDEPTIRGTETDVGDLSVLFKYALCNDCATGHVLSIGLAITTPTATSDDNPFHGVVLQPWVGFIKRCGDWFVHGFTAVDVPVDGDDVTILFNDIGIGYRLFTSPDPCACITGVTPMFEVHVNTPLNHRGALRTTDLAGTADGVDLTLATSIELWGTARLSIGAITPVTGPRPFDIELAAALNWRF